MNKKTYKKIIKEVAIHFDFFIDFLEMMFPFKEVKFLNSNTFRRYIVRAAKFPEKNMFIEHIWSV